MSQIDDDEPLPSTDELRAISLRTLRSVADDERCEPEVRVEAELLFRHYTRRDALRPKAS
jgi:hypothetical protein